MPFTLPNTEQSVFNRSSQGWHTDSKLLDDVLDILTPRDPKSAISSIMGPSPLIAGVFRELGLQRVSGMLSPENYAIQLADTPGYNRYLQLVQNMVKKKFGESFRVLRGSDTRDIMQHLVKPSGELARATAVTTDPQVAKSFAQGRGASSAGGAHVLEATATPESVLGLVPTRNTGWNESELLVDPKKLQELRPALKYTYGEGPGPASPVLAQALEHVRAGREIPPEIKAQLTPLYEAAKSAAKTVPLASGTGVSWIQKKADLVGLAPDRFEKLMNKAGWDSVKTAIYSEDPKKAALSLIQSIGGLD